MLSVKDGTSTGDNVLASAAIAQLTFFATSKGVDSRKRQMVPGNKADGVPFPAAVSTKLKVLPAEAWMTLSPWPCHSPSIALKGEISAEGSCPH